jgi:excisionase family DNA binding protein
MERLLSVKEAAERLSCSPAAVRKWLYQRRLPRVKVGRLTRVRTRDLDAFVAQGADRHFRATGGGPVE